MADKKHPKKVTAIVPAHNEAARIADVLTVVTSYPGLEEVIVVDDGSTDATAEVVKQFPVQYIRLPSNQGKGQAMQAGVEAASGDVFFFTDADVRGLTHSMLHDIIEPVRNGEVDMFIGMRNRKIYFLRALLTFVPLLGGERAISRSLWDKVPERYKEKFKIEVAFNFYAKYYGQGFRYKVFDGLSQTIKEKKYGLAEGVRRRIKMFYEIFAAQMELEFSDLPRNIQTARLALLQALGSMAGVAVGFFLLAATYIGPRRFLLWWFRNDLQRESHTPVINFLLETLPLLSVEILITLSSVIIVINSLIIFLQLKRIRPLLHRTFSKAAAQDY